MSRRGDGVTIRNKLRNTVTLAVIAGSVCALSSCDNNTSDKSQMTLPTQKSELTTADTKANPQSTDSYPTTNIDHYATLPFFGELHVHSSNSPDAYITGVRSSPEDAYRYAKGQSINHISGIKISNRSPLDFMAVTDHAEYMGILPALSNPTGPLANTWYGKEILSGDPVRYQKATQKILFSLSGTPPKAIAEITAESITSPIWQGYVELAEKYNEPGVFTTFVGYEWTLIPNSQNLHRNIIFKGTDVPALPFSAFDSDKPEALWQWMEQARANGSDVLAIPHNSNVSDGTMFALNDSWGNPISEQYAKLRMRNEPLVEMSQIKGTSETHPSLSPNDEWADFEILQELLGGQRIGKISGSYVREAYLNGLALQQEKGFNPFQFGMLAASDSHNASVPVEEDNYTGKLGVDATAESRRGGSFINSQSSLYGASGLAGVWAHENSRSALFEAMQRKEVFATSGPKMAIRLFAGNYPKTIKATGLPSQELYLKGVAMGNVVNSEHLVENNLPLYVWALKDKDGHNLQRLQIVKGWYDKGELNEAVFDVACSDGLSPNPNTHRCPNNNAGVDLTNCSVEKNKGNTQLATVWRDPSFNKDQAIFYYARVLENPSCRWTTWDALRNDWPLLDNVPATIQERAWSSPLWYHPLSQQEDLTKNHRTANTVTKNPHPPSLTP
tara:strand:+ start:5995 stop:8013 length:2019 start_codon:yes stop_codon:yes gene_type:complete